MADRNFAEGKGYSKEEEASDKPSLPLCMATDLSLTAWLTPNRVAILICAPSPANATFQPFRTTDRELSRNSLRRDFWGCGKCRLAGIS